MMFNSLLNFFTKSVLTDLLDKLDDTDYKSSWSKGKLVSQLQTHGAESVLKKLTVSQLNDLLDEHSLLKSGTKANKVSRLVDFCGGTVEEVDSISGGFEDAMNALMDNNDWEQRMLTEWNRFYGLLKQFLSENSDLEKVMWQQYSLYFNDGDACNFEIQFAQLTYANLVATGSWEDVDECLDRSDNPVQPTKSVQKSMKLFWNLLALHQHSLEYKFGNHSEIHAELKAGKVKFQELDCSGHD